MMYLHSMQWEGYPVCYELLPLCRHYNIREAFRCNTAWKPRLLGHSLIGRLPLGIAAS